MPRNRSGLQTRSRILDAIRELLAEQGLEATTVKAICKRAEVGAGSFYNLFDTKEGAVLEVVREAVRLVDPDPEHAGEDDLQELVDAYVAFVMQTPQLARIYVELGLGGSLSDDKFVGRVLRHHKARVTRFSAALRLAEPDLSAEDAHLRSESVVASLTGMTVTWLIDPSFDFPGHARRLVADVTSPRKAVRVGS